MLSLAPGAGEPEAVRRKSCPSYHPEAADNVIISPRPPPIHQPVRSCSTTERTPIGVYDVAETKQQVDKRLHRFEDEIKKAFSHVRKASTHFKGRMSPSRSDEEEPTYPTPMERTLTVVYASDNHKKKKSSLDDLLEADDVAQDSGDVNANPVLQLERLQDAMFTASIALDKFPVGGDIIVRCSGYRLDFYWKAHRNKGSHHRHSTSVCNTKPVYCNNVSLPMYVDTHKLDITLITNSKIQVKGRTKCFMSRRKSISSEDLVIDKILKQPSKSPKPKRKEKLRKHSGALSDFFNEARDRAYTS